MGEHVRVGVLDIWTERTGEGPDVLLIGGLGDVVESWQFQFDGLSDRYRLTAFDNRGAGRTALPDATLTAATLADTAAALLRALETPRAHIAGFSMGSAIAQELALRHPELVRNDTADRLSQIAPPTLVLSGELDLIMPPRVGRSVAAEIPNARFEVMPGEAHQPFQEVPDEFNARVHAFWREVEASG